MIFENLIINDSIWGNLSSSFKKNKIPNAFIFSGDDGTGKEGHAIEFSALLNCKRVENNLFACGDCRSCMKSKKLKHEEIHFIHPSPTPKNKTKTSHSILDPKTIEELNKNYDVKSKNPYHKINLDGSNTIPIDLIRNLKKKLYYSKSDENWTVVIIFNSEKLCIPKAESANSLLKILEEPPERTLFILLTSNSNLLLPTIQSRCQKIFFKNFDNTELIKYVNENITVDVNPESIDLASGSVSRLLDDLNNNRSSKFLELLDLFYTNDLKDIEKFLSKANKIKTKNKNELPIYLNFLKVSSKDLLILSLNNENQSVDYKFLKEKYLSIINLFPNSNWEKVIELIDESSINISRNINFSLEIYSLLINVQSCLLGNSVNRLNAKIMTQI